MSGRFCEGTVGLANERSGGRLLGAVVVAGVLAFGRVAAEVGVAGYLGLGEEGLGLEVGVEMGEAEGGLEGAELVEGGPEGPGGGLALGEEGIEAALGFYDLPAELLGLLEHGVVYPLNRLALLLAQGQLGRELEDVLGARGSR